MPKPTALKALAAANLFLSASALAYDWEALSRVPAWALPFIAICPLYPAFLAGVWLIEARGERVPKLLLAIAALPSATYGILSLAFYPLLVTAGQPSWILWQIAWVWLYSAQGWWLLLRERTLNRFLLPVAAAFSLSLALQLATDSYGYIGIDLLPRSQGMALLSVGVAIAFGIPAIQRPGRTEHEGI